MGPFLLPNEGTPFKMKKRGLGMLGGVLFISSSSADAEFVTGALGRVSICVRSVRTIEAARQILEREIFGAILTESSLPDAHWKDVIALAQSTRREMPVIVCDRQANAGLWTDVLDYGAYDLIATPFCIPEVQRIVANAIRESPRLVRIPPAAERRAMPGSISAIAG
jgi:DNA-binding NtrC family response regulator